MIREAYVPIWKLAAGLGWDIVKTRKTFIRAGFAVKLPGSREWTVSREWLAVKMATVLARLDELEDAGLLRSTRGCKRRGVSGRFEASATVANLEHCA